MGIELLPEQIRKKFWVAERHHACAILRTDFPKEWDDLAAVLTDFRLCRSHIIAPGGGKSPIAKALNGAFYKRDWKKKVFKIKVEVDDEVTLSPTHEVDYFKNRVAIETEWNNKTEFYDRDLTTFRLLFDINVLSVGIVITRADELQEIFDELGKGSSYGPSTTIFSKLIPKLDNRAPGGCPVLAFGMTKGTYDQNC